MKYNNPILSGYIKSIFGIIRGVFILLSIQSIVFSEVLVDDGSSTGRMALDGPHYQITAGIGRQSGSNLFHSFSLFDIASGESATFTSEGSALDKPPIDNIIGRITSSSHSNINGIIRSEIPGANLFLFNPNGFIFGSDAKLDIGGSFYVSTANYIKFEEGSIFSSVWEKDEVLSVEAPSAFGFLGHRKPAGIVFNGTLNNKQGFSIIGGDLTVSEKSHLAASKGLLTIASLASAGEVRLENGGINTEDILQMGRIDLSNPTGSLEIERSRFRSTLAGQQVVIRGGELILEDSLITALSSEDSTPVNNNAIDIQLTEKLVLQGTLSHIRLPDSSRNLSILANDIQIQAGAKISIENTTASQNNKLSIVAQNITIEGTSAAINNAQNSLIQSKGNSDISINTRSLQITNGGMIKAIEGNIEIEANKITLNGVERGLRSEILTTNSVKSSIGNIMVNTTDMSILNGARIETTAGSEVSSAAGNLTINAQHIIVNGTGGGENNDQFFSSIQAEDQRSTANETELATLELNTNSLIIEEGATVSTRTIGPGHGAELVIKANEIRLQNQGTISASSESRPSNTLLNTGNAGNITITTDFLNLGEQSQITTSAIAEGNGTGGNIIIKPNSDISNLIILQSASKIIANVKTGTGDAGNIDITINDGGTLFQTSDSLIQASSLSGLGIDGNIEINTPDTDITSLFKPLSSRIVDASIILQKPCAQRYYSDTIAFVNQQYEVLPDSPYALRTGLADSILSTEPDQLSSNPSEVSHMNLNESPDILCQQTTE